MTSNHRAPFPMLGNVKDGQGLVEPAVAAVSDTYGMPGAWVSLTHAVVAVVSPVLLRYRRNVTGFPGSGLGFKATREALTFAAVSPPLVMKYMSVEALDQKPPMFVMA